MAINFQLQQNLPKWASDRHWNKSEVSTKHWISNGNKFKRKEFAFESLIAKTLTNLRWLKFIAVFCLCTIQYTKPRIGWTNFKMKNIYRILFLVHSISTCLKVKILTCLKSHSKSTYCSVQSTLHFCIDKQRNCKKSRTIIKANAESTNVAWAAPATAAV